LTRAASDPSACRVRGSCPTPWTAWTRARVEHQLLSGDQAHTLRVAVEHDAAETYTFYSESDNSIPLTLYARLLMGTVGFTELALRGPVMLSDILLVLAPLLLLR
jgi:hypothetical protein